MLNVLISMFIFVKKQLGSDVYGYKTMLEYPINQYTYHDGTNPFGKAPDSKTVIVHWKNITEA